MRRLVCQSKRCRHMIVVYGEVPDTWLSTGDGVVICPCCQRKGRTGAHDVR